MEEYDYFMVFQLLDSGERELLDTKEPELEDILDPEEVFVVVKEDLRRIFIWKGAKSPVRKRFISSRVASGLQEELVKEANFHRCKIVSVDQGDEPVEFLQAFGLESMEVTDKLADMRYVRNIEKDPSRSVGKVLNSDGSTDSQEEEEYYSPALEELKRKGVDVSKSMKTSKSEPKPQQPKKSKVKSKKKTPKKPKIVSAEEEIKNKVLENDILENYRRQNLIIGKNLYGSVSRVTNVFGDDIEEKDWELVATLPKGIYELNNYLLRIYFDKENSVVEAVEILKSEKEGTPSKMEKTTIELNENSDLKFKEKLLEVKVPDGYRRVNLIIGHRLYGATSKTVQVFGEEIAETEWDLLTSVPEGVISLENHLFRIYFNKQNKQVDAIEILKEEGTKPKLTPDNTKKSKSSSESKNIKNSGNKKRDLPKIPSSKD